MIAVPPAGVHLDSPEDVIVGQAANFTCQATLGSNGSVFLSNFNETTGQFQEITFGEKTSKDLLLDRCKKQQNVTYSLALDMSLNFTSLRCEINSTTISPNNSDNSQQPDNHSRHVTLKLIPGKYCP